MVLQTVVIVVFIKMAQNIRNYSPFKTKQICIVLLLYVTGISYATCFRIFVLLNSIVVHYGITSFFLRLTQNCTLLFQLMMRVVTTNERLYSCNVSHVISCG